MGGCSLLPSNKWPTRQYAVSENRSLASQAANSRCVRWLGGLRGGVHTRHKMEPMEAEACSDASPSQHSGQVSSQCQEQQVAGVEAGLMSGAPTTTQYTPSREPVWPACSLMSSHTRVSACWVWQ